MNAGILVFPRFGTGAKNGESVSIKILFLSILDLIKTIPFFLNLEILLRKFFLKDNDYITGLLTKIGLISNNI